MLSPMWALFMGLAASMGLCFSASLKGSDLLPNARIMIHQPWGGVRGQAADIAIHAKEILRTRERLNDILAK